MGWGGGVSQSSRRDKLNKKIIVGENGLCWGVGWGGGVANQADVIN